MQKIISTTYQDEMLILYLLADHNADVDTLQKEIMTLSRNNIAFEQQYIGVLLYRLRTERLVKRTTNKRYEPMHEITEIGRQVLADYLVYYRQHESGIRHILSSFFRQRGRIMSRIFGIRLYSLRTNKTNFTQTQVAKLLHLERSTYTKYECGVTEPSLQTLREIKKVFNVSYDELLGEKLSEAEIIDYDLFRNNQYKPIK